MAWIPVVITTTGANGSGVGHTTVNFSGYDNPAIVCKVHVPTNAAFPNTSDITISEVMGDASLVSTWVISNITTPISRPLATLGYDATGTVTTQYAPQFMSGIDIAIAQANAGTITIWVLIA